MELDFLKIMVPDLVYMLVSDLEMPISCEEWGMNKALDDVFGTSLETEGMTSRPPVPMPLCDAKS